MWIVDTAELARTLSVDCLLYILAYFSGSAGHKVVGFTLCTAHALYVPLTRKMRKIWKVGINLLGT